MIGKAASVLLGVIYPMIWTLHMMYDFDVFLAGRFFMKE